MDYLKYLNKFFICEWNENEEYGGRKLIVPHKTILYYYMTQPIQAGLLYMMPDGGVYINGKHVTQSDRLPDEYSCTHKKLLALVYNKLGLTGDIRQNVEKLYDEYYNDNIRGRIIEDTIYIWNDAGNLDSLEEKRFEFKKKKCIESIYRYIPENIFK